MAQARKKPVTPPAALRRQRLLQIERMRIDLLRQVDRAYLYIFDQIERAYHGRLRTRLSRKNAAALEAEYMRQVALADAERYRQTALVDEEYERQIALTESAHGPERPRRRVSHAKTASRFWKHFARDGRAVPPWEISVGPGLDIDTSAADYTGSIWDEPPFAEGDYDYDDFDADWGGYEYEDTGYPDENT